MTARICNYFGLVPAKASVAFPFSWKFNFEWRKSICWKFNLFIWRTFVSQESTSGEILTVGDLTRDSDHILQRHDLVDNYPSPSQSEMALILYEIAITRECMSAVFDHLNDLFDSLCAFCEKRERDHRVNRDVAISKSTSPAYAFMESMESDYRPLRINDQHGWRTTLCFHYKAPGHVACELPKLSAAGLIWTSTGEIDMIL